MSDKLNQALSVQHQQLESLKLILEAELSLISARNPDALIKILEEKEVLLDGISQQSTEIASLFPEDRVLNEALQEKVTAIKNLLSECKYRTDINEKAVEQGQLRLAHLRSLIVESRSRESMTYDKSGQTYSSNKGKGISA
ncbi:flagellar export chaperone FlgN [Alteromonadaceae bacterium BrNp21-10]|nr:flagellar export chaperone FlgN [Alteromonadaceae bacterium BrNp21-10]